MSPWFYACPHHLQYLLSFQLSRKDNRQASDCHSFVFVYFSSVATRRSQVPQLKRVLRLGGSGMSRQIRPLRALKRVQLMPDIFLCAGAGPWVGHANCWNIFDWPTIAGVVEAGHGFPPFRPVVIGFCLMELERGNNFIELDFNMAYIFVSVCPEQKDPRYIWCPVREKGKKGMPRLLYVSRKSTNY